MLTAPPVSPNCKDVFVQIDKYICVEEKLTFSGQDYKVLWYADCTTHQPAVWFSIWRPNWPFHNYLQPLTIFTFQQGKVPFVNVFTPLATEFSSVFYNFLVSHSVSDKETDEKTKEGGDDEIMDDVTMYVDSVLDATACTAAAYFQFLTS